MLHSLPSLFATKKLRGAGPLYSLTWGNGIYLDIITEIMATLREVRKWVRIPTPFEVFSHVWLKAPRQVSENPEVTQICFNALKKKVKAKSKWKKKKKQHPKTVVMFVLFNSAFGEGNGNPLQSSCLENPLNRVVWQATVHGVAKSQTQLS